MEKLDFEKLFKLQIVIMKLNQCHPDIKINKYWLLKIMIIQGPHILYFFLLSYCIKHYVVIGDYFNTFNNVVPLTYFISLIFFYYLLIINRLMLRNLIKSVKNDYDKALEMNERLHKVVVEYAIKGKYIMKFWFILLTVSLGMFVLKTICLSYYHTKRNGELTLIPFHEMHYPLNLTMYRENNNLYVYAVTYLGEFYFTAMCVVIYISTVPLGTIFMLHACGQMELIKIKFENVFQRDNVDENLNDIAKNLQNIYSFIKEINVCFTLMYEIMLKQTVFLPPFLTFAMVQSIHHGVFTVEYVGLFIQAIISSGFSCYYGDLLMQKGEEVQQAAYNCGWERVHIPSARKTLLIIMTRAVKPVAIQTIFSTICLDTLTNVYRQAYTIFNLMNAMWN